MRGWRACAFAAVVAGFGGAAFADDGPPVSIIGGTSTTAGQYPSVVAVVVDSNLCTGTLVAPTWVITAAHCVDPLVLGFSSQDQVTANTRVHLNTLDVSNQLGTVVMASATFKDPLFNKSRLGANDLGLIQLASPITNIDPSPINLVASKAPVGTAVTVVGFGSTEHPGTQGTIGVEFDLGRTTISCPSLRIGADTNLLCFSQADNKGTCQGDSGGPWFAMIDGKRTVVGVTSFGDPQCAEFGAGTRLDIEEPFITMHVPELAGCFKDSDCPAQRACFARRCIAAPFSPTGIGSICNTGADCESSQCAESSQDGKRCSMVCSVSDDSTCPEGFECLRAMGDVGACWPAPGGGCCDAGGRGDGALVLAGVVALVLRRRRGCRSLRRGATVDPCPVERTKY